MPDITLSMHLTQAHVAALIPLFQRFLETGTIDTPTEADAPKFLSELPGLVGEMLCGSYEEFEEHFLVGDTVFFIRGSKQATGHDFHIDIDAVANNQ